MSNNIPSEIILHILKQLTSDADLVQCAYVCKRWTYLSLELLWYKPNFTKSKSWLTFFKVIQSTQTSFPYTSFIRRINLTPLSSSIEDIHIITLNDCIRCALINRREDNGIGASLISIDLSDVYQITNNTIIKVASCCPNLQGFNLSMSQEQQLITDIGITQLAKKCKDLKRVNKYII
jgi:F-box and leucine-rich repeat protein GRR1